MPGVGSSYYRTHTSLQINCTSTGLGWLHVRKNRYSRKMNPNLLHWGPNRCAKSIGLPYVQTVGIWYVWWCTMYGGLAVCNLCRRRTPRHQLDPPPPPPISEKGGQAGRIRGELRPTEAFLWHRLGPSSPTPVLLLAGHPHQKGPLALGPRPLWGLHGGRRWAPGPITLGRHLATPRPLRSLLTRSRCQEPGGGEREARPGTGYCFGYRMHMPCPPKPIPALALIHRKQRASGSSATIPSMLPMRPSKRWTISYPQNHS